MVIYGISLDFGGFQKVKRELGTSRSEMIESELFVRLRFGERFVDTFLATVFKLFLQKCFLAFFSYYYLEPILQSKIRSKGLGHLFSLPSVVDVEDIFHDLNDLFVVMFRNKVSDIVVLSRIIQTF